MDIWSCFLPPKKINYLIISAHEYKFSATSECLKYIKSNFNTKMIVISGNMCVDKKPSAMNWSVAHYVQTSSSWLTYSIIIIRIRIEGRGKSVLAEVTIPSKVVETIFKTTVDKMVSLSHAKLNLGTSAAITIGGWNAHAANVVAAIFLATGQVSALFSRPIKYLVKKQRMRLKW